MSYHTWSTDGYGFCVNGINTTAEKVETLLLHAPKFSARLKEYFKDIDIDTPTIDDYLAYEDDESCELRKGLAAILAGVIEETEHIELTAVDDFDCNWYVLLEPSYPWAKISIEELSLTKESLKEIFQKYIKILTDKDVSIDYCSVENGG